MNPKSIIFLFFIHVIFVILKVKTQPCTNPDQDETDNCESCIEKNRVYPNCTAGVCINYFYGSNCDLCQDGYIQDGNCSECKLPGKDPEHGCASCFFYFKSEMYGNCTECIDFYKKVNDKLCVQKNGLDMLLDGVLYILVVVGGIGMVVCVTISAIVCFICLIIISRKLKRSKEDKYLET